MQQHCQYMIQLEAESLFWKLVVLQLFVEQIAIVVAVGEEHVVLAI